MPGLVPGIHVLAAAKKDVDGRVKPGHDEKRSVVTFPLTLACCGNESFSSEIRFVPFGHGRRRKFNGSRIRNARFSVTYGRAPRQFHCCLTRLPHPLTGASSRPT
jgi:hypothetical protein